MKTLLTSLFLFSISCSYACLNGDSKEINGRFLYVDEEGHVIPKGHHFYLNDAATMMDELDSLWRSTGEVMYRSDYALMLILVKRYEEAEKILLEIEHDFPGRYSTSSNIGTLYELTGKNDKALQWISKAVSIDPASHWNSEWIHVNILKAKLAGEEAYTMEFLVGKTFGDGVIPSSELSHTELEVLRSQLYYQLNERMSFISPPDKIVSVLLTALGDVCWLTGLQVPAAKNYSRAREYDDSDDRLRAKFRRSQEKQIMLTPGKRDDARDFSMLYAVILICGAIMAVTAVRNYALR